jgi:putative IMPACT (imprinted ancient) family translation regulator
MPILLALRGGPLSDALLVVVRWYGGTKLGRGGLVRAYGQAARQAVQEAGQAARLAVTRLEVELPYDRLGAVQRLLEPPAVQVLEETYHDTARLVLQVQVDRLAALRERLAELRIESHETEKPNRGGS